jgi:hypothetical protein
MARSYKKHPGFRDRSHNGTKVDKRIANKKVRKAPFVDNGSHFKKWSDRYDIYDWNFRYYSRKEAVRKLSEYYGEKVYQAWMK